jgi:hypothetical protein
MPLYNRIIKIEEWKPIYYSYFIDELWKKFGTSKPNKLNNENVIQFVFIDASFLNNDQLIVMFSFLKGIDGNYLTFIAGNESIKWFDWDLTTESIIIKKYNNFIDEYFKIKN